MNSNQQQPVQPTQKSPREIFKSLCEESKRLSWTRHFGHFDLASPFEVAQIAISLGVMKGETAPDLEGAFKLIRFADSHIQLVNTHHKAKEDEKQAKNAKDLHHQEIAEVLSKAPIEFHKGFPGSEKIKPPKRFPASTASCWRAILGRSLSKKELVQTLNLLKESAPEIECLTSYRPGYEVAFWWWAKSVVPHVPRFAKLYGQEPKRKPRIRSRNNQFTSSERNALGQFAKKMQGIENTD